MIGLGNARRVQLALWQLKGDASFWWEAIERYVIGWDEFGIRFERKFLSRAESDRQLERFLHLKQGSSSVREYIRQLSELSRFGIELVDTPEKKAGRFAKGLTNLPRFYYHRTFLWVHCTRFLVEITLRTSEPTVETPKEEPRTFGGGEKP